MRQNRARNPALHVVCADGRKNLGDSDRHIRGSMTLEDAFRCHTWPHAVEFPIRDPPNSIKQDF